MDKFENIDRIVQPREVRSLRITNNETAQVIEILPEQLTGPLSINLGRTAYNVFCMYSIPTSIRGSPMVDRRNFAFGDAFTVEGLSLCFR